LFLCNILQTKNLRPIVLLKALALPALFPTGLLMSLCVSRGPEIAAAAQGGSGFCLLLTQEKFFLEAEKFYLKIACDIEVFAV